MNSKTIALLFTMMSLGGLLVPGLTPSPVSALPVNEDELVNSLLENIEDFDLSEEELDDLLERLGISEDEDGEAVWCYQRQGDVTVCFETQEECQQALDEDDLSTTSHCERFETAPPNAVFP